MLKEGKTMKKNGGKLLSLSLAAGLVLCGGALAGCSSDGGYTLDTPGDVYSFAAATSAAMPVSYTHLTLPTT